MEETMLRNVVFAAVTALILSTVPTLAETQFATPEEAKALLDKAVAALKDDETKALGMFATGEGGFKDKDLYVWCANASDGIASDEQGQGAPRHQGQARRSVR
jgi:hypothetical protein